MGDLKIIDSGLVPVYETSKGVKVVYGSELHRVLNVTSPYREWSGRRLNDVDAVEKEDYTGVEISTPSGQTRKDHIIRLDTAKEMAMLERNDKGKEVRKYFIEVEKRFKTAVIDRSSLSPQMQMFYAIADAQAKQELEQKRIAAELKQNTERMDKIERKIDATAQALEPIHPETWRKDVTKKFNRVQKASEIPWEELYVEMYKELDRRAGVDTARRLMNRRERMRVDGISQTNIRKVTRMDIIQEDKKLRAIFERILSEYEIKYCDE